MKNIISREYSDKILSLVPSFVFELLFDSSAASSIWTDHPNVVKNLSFSEFVFS